MTVDSTFLVEAARRGDHEAFCTLLERSDALLRLVIGRRVSPDAVEDALQETFLEAWQGISKLRDPGTFRGWLVRIACSRANRWIQRQALEHSVLAKLAVSEEAPVPASGWSDPVLQALDALDPKARAIVYLRHCDELSTEEVAHDLNMTVPNVRQRLSRSMIELRKRLKPTED